MECFWQYQDLDADDIRRFWDFDAIFCRKSMSYYSIV